MHNQDEALGAKLLLWLVHGMHIRTQPLDRTMMKAAELEIKMNFHAGMPLVYNYIATPLIQYFVYVEHEVVSVDD